MSKMTEERRKDQTSNWYFAFERTYCKLEEMKVEKETRMVQKKKKQVLTADEIANLTDFELVST